MKWNALYKVLFGRGLNADEVTVWDDLLLRDFRNITPGEIADALEAMAEKYRHRGEQGKPPTYPQLKSAIIGARYERRQADSPPEADCAMCRKSGWVEVWPAIVPPFSDGLWDRRAVEASKSIPCRCNNGKRARGLCSIEDRELTHLQLLATQQYIAFTNEALKFDGNKPAEREPVAVGAGREIGEGEEF